MTFGYQQTRPDFTHSTLSAQVLGGHVWNSRRVNWGQRVHEHLGGRRVSGQRLLEPQLERRRGGPEGPAREQRKRRAPSKREVWGQEGDARLGRPARSLPRAQGRPSSGFGHTQHWADSPGHPLRPERRGCNLGPLLVLRRTFGVFPALYRHLSPLCPPEFSGTGPIPGS